MGLIDDDHRVLRQLAVVLHLGEHDAVGHSLDRGPLRHLVGKANLVTNEPSEFITELARHPFGDAPGGNATRLGMADPTALVKPELQTHLWKLGALARTGLPGDHYDLVVSDRVEDLVATFADRQFRWVGPTIAGDAVPSLAIEFRELRSSGGSAP